ncbi:MAG: FAD-dependent oxidoreductase [Parvibaculaceae bacterium]
MMVDKVDVIVIGGGIIGCSIAYHLARRGITDTLLLERRQLCCGTTWHSVGSVAEFRGSRILTELAKYSVGLYRSLEAETGMATGYKKSGSIMLALNQERLMEMQRTIALARAYGAEAQMISIADVQRLCPHVKTDDALAGLYIPTDGRTNPVDTTQALARGAKMRGATIREDMPVEKLVIENGAVTGVLTKEGVIHADAVVIAGGMWGREFAQGHGVALPLQAAEHFYAVTQPIADLRRNIPFIRVPDESTYYKEDTGKLLFGCLEPRAKPWALDGISESFCFDALPEDLDHFEPIFAAAVQRFPLLESAEIKIFFNGPESFTPDGNALLGETPEVKNLFVACGMNTVGVMTGGGVGKVMAEWIATRERPPGLGAYDVARTPAFQISRSFRHDRTVEALGVLYGVGWPNREYASARGARRSPLHHWHAVKNAVMGERAGWEVPLVYAPAGVEADLRCSYGHQNWEGWASAECRRALDAAVLFDLSALAKIEISGPESDLALADLSPQKPKTGLGCAVWPTAKDTIEAVVTVAALGAGRHLVLSEPGTERRHLHWLRKRVAPDRDATAREATAGLAVLLIAGPEAASIVARAAPGHDPMADRSACHVGYAPCHVWRCDHYGIDGWLIAASTEFAGHVVEALEQAASGSLAPAGHYALEALRIRAGTPAWPRDLDDQVPANETVTTKLVRVVPASCAVPLYGGEGILRDGRHVGQVTSGHWGPFDGKPEALGFISNAGGVDQAWIENGRFEIDAPGGPYPAACVMLPFWQVVTAAGCADKGRARQ